METQSGRTNTGPKPDQHWGRLGHNTRLHEGLDLFKPVDHNDLSLNSFRCHGLNPEEGLSRSYSKRDNATSLGQIENAGRPISSSDSPFFLFPFFLNMENLGK
ncbi:hypothetical protein SLE2022_198150 [Rubroshorea leprosula]